MENQENQTSFLLEPHKNSKIKKVIGVVSGKGGVGKSLTTSLLAVKAAQQGKKVAIIDADVTGPSIPRIFGLNEMLTGTENSIYPAVTKLGIKVVSLNLMTNDPGAPVVWRGPVISGLIRQFWTDVEYGDIDELYVDMPPGTGDVPLTVFQSLPVNAIVVVATPQDLVSMIVEKAVRMAEMMDIPVLGLVMNMAYLDCPKCGERIHPFGEGKTEEIANKFSIPFVAELPIDPSFSDACDKGEIESLEVDYLQEISSAVNRLKAK